MVSLLYSKPWLKNLVFYYYYYFVSTKLFDQFSKNACQLQKTHKVYFTIDNIVKILGLAHKPRVRIKIHRLFNVTSTRAETMIASSPNAPNLNNFFILGRFRVFLFIRTQKGKKLHRFGDQVYVFNCISIQVWWARGGGWLPHSIFYPRM